MKTKRHRDNEATWQEGATPLHPPLLRRETLRYLTVVALTWWAGPVLQTANAQSGGGYLIKKGVVASGGHSDIAGGDYQLTGTVGQHDVGPVSGGDYVVTGGFWSPAPSANPPEAVTPDPSGVNKSRFISFVMPAAMEESAVRVWLVSLHHVVPPYAGGPSVPFDSFEGQSRWVGPPVEYVESTSKPTPFHASSLQCTPHYQDWSTVGLLHVTGSAIVPSSTYEVENVAASCMGMESTCIAVSAPLEIATTRWADVVAPFNPPDLSEQPDFSDVGALVDKFKSIPGAPIKARALLAGSDGFGNINIAPDLGFNHIAACVDAFRGLPYPYTIAGCP